MEENSAPARYGGCRHEGRRAYRTTSIALAAASLMVLVAAMGILSPGAPGGSARTEHASAAHPALATGATATAAIPATHVGPVRSLGATTSHFGSISTTSTNWAGYAIVPAAGGGVIQEVTAEWSIPTATCGQPSGAALDAQWVGIDGYGNGNVSQTGTAAYCSSPGATPTYYLWWEFYPYNSAQFIYSASAGDFVQAYVLYNAAACVNGHCGIYDLILNDLSSGNSISVTGDAAVCSGSNCEGGPDASAECVSEEPAGYDLTKATKVTFLACAVEINGLFKGIGSFSNSTGPLYKITQTGPVTGLVAQSVSALSTYYYGKSEFSIGWHHYH